jgi:capsular polysaccharide biosynthesis protein
MVKVMEMEKVNIIEAGNIPLEPSSPNVLRSTLIGGITGCLLVSVAIMIYMVSNDSIKTVEDIEKYLDMTTLGVIPNEGELSVKKRKLTRVKRNKKSAIAS